MASGVKDVLTVNPAVAAALRARPAVAKPTRAQAEKMVLMQAAKRYFNVQNYAQAVDAFQAVLNLDPNDMEALSYSYLSALRRDFPFWAAGESPYWEHSLVFYVEEKLLGIIEVIGFIRSNPGISVKKLAALARKDREAKRAQVLVRGKAAGGFFGKLEEGKIASGKLHNPGVLADLRARLIRLTDLAKGVLSVEACSQKRGVRSQAIDHFKNGEYVEAERSFKSALEIDPNDMELFCYLSLSKLRKAGDLLGIREIKKRAVLVIEKLERRIAVIAFFRKNPSMPYAQIEADHPYIFNSIIKQASYRIFFGFPRARIVAGIKVDLDGTIADEKEKIRAEAGEIQRELVAVADPIRASVEEAFRASRYSKAVALAEQFTGAENIDPQLFGFYGLSLLYRDHGFLLERFMAVGAKMLNPVSANALLEEGNREGLEREFRIAKEFLAPLIALAQAKRADLERQGRACFERKRYALSAAYYERLLLEVDPRDVWARCLYYLALLHNDYDFLDGFAPKYRPEKFKEYEEPILAVLRQARRLTHRIAVIEFVLSHPELTTGLSVRDFEGRYPALANDPKIFDLIAGDSTRRTVFVGIRESRVAAGIESDPLLLDEQIIPKIDTEMEPWGIDPPTGLLEAGT